MNVFPFLPYSFIYLLVFREIPYKLLRWNHYKSFLYGELIFFCYEYGELLNLYSFNLQIIL